MAGMRKIPDDYWRSSPYRHEEAAATGVGGRIRLTRRERLSFGESAGQRIVVAVGTGSVGVLDDPAQEGAVRNFAPRPPGERRGQHVAGDALDPLALPLPVGRTHRLDQPGLVVGCGRG